MILRTLKISGSKEVSDDVGPVINRKPIITIAIPIASKDAAEFSFFLAVPTMFAATGYKVLKLFLDGGTEILVNNMPALIIGNVVAFIVALLAIKFFISFVTKYGFKAFGWYRIIVGGTILVMLLLGYNLEIG